MDLSKIDIVSEVESNRVGQGVKKNHAGNVG